MTYTPKYFKVQELVTPNVYVALGANSLIVMDARILQTIDLIREHFGFPITVNNWYKGGTFDQRGFRDTTVGAVHSQHRYGRAIDFDVAGFTADAVRKELIAKRDKFEHITTIEADTNWVHIDCRNVERILIVRP